MVSQLAEPRFNSPFPTSVTQAHSESIELYALYKELLLIDWIDWPEQGNINRTVVSVTMTHAHQYEQYLQLTVGSRLHPAEGWGQIATIYWAMSTFFRLEAGVNKPTNQHPYSFT